MKSITIKDRKNRRLIFRVLGISQADYQLMQIDFMQKYLEEYVQERSLIADLLDCEAFNKWFINLWNRRNTTFIHKYCLRSQAEREAKGKPVRYNKESLLARYREYNRIHHTMIYPDSTVFDQISKEIYKPKSKGNGKQQH